MAKTILFSAEEKKKIIDEFTTTDISARKLALKYNIKQTSTIYVWQNRYKQKGIAGLIDAQRGRKAKINKEVEFEKTKQELEHLRREMQIKEKKNKKLTSKVKVMEKYTASLVKE
ncbi:helix-turn-helix domain-containing protein [Spiroplasma tabanidicola]|uniref:Insertion element IS150 protein InsJ-like helix-turn-helix domain-containing protein n=1 Tax=Spiroplasma tabanidicola TaxID=324079 RepID=A0A6I6C9C1_9MOLU|nr:helix-turn-helix domain-containing protein [Spiroplasma tabanidicola]QGS52196.1 hypothetical protein STABA_v1c08410 [Spiroplasma tabanidicola]